MAFVIGVTRGVKVLHGILNVGNISQAHGRTIAIRDDERAILVCLEKLIVVAQNPPYQAVRKLPFGFVRVDLAEGCAHVIQSQTVMLREPLDLPKFEPQASPRR